MSLVEIWIIEMFWVKDNLSLVNDKNTPRKH
jgi:hypothetical protein